MTRTGEMRICSLIRVVILSAIAVPLRYGAMKIRPRTFSVPALARRPLEISLKWVNFANGWAGTATTKLPNSRFTPQFGGLLLAPDPFTIISLVEGSWGCCRSARRVGRRLSSGSGFDGSETMGVEGLRLTVSTAALAVLIAGCSRSGPELQPVEGQVLLNGAPVSGAKIIFQPAGEVDPLATNPSATSGADGKFKLGTYPHGDGAKAGEYVACVIIPPGAEARVGGSPLKDLPGRYASRETSKLPVTVKSGPNQLEPFKLAK
jgi:hypothetical protein